MSDLSELKGIQAPEVATLRARNFKTVEDLWERVGDDFEQGVADLETTTTIPAARLRELLFLDLRRFAAQKPSAGQSWLSVHWLETVVVVLVLLLLLLLLRAVGVFAGLPIGSDLSGQVVVSGSPIEKGQVIPAATLGLARVVASEVFTDTASLNGLIAANPIPVGKPIRYADVLRPQVAAVEDIPAGTIVAASAITTTWSAYLPGAATDAALVVNQKTTHPVQKNQVIFSAFLEAGSIPDDTVVVVNPDGLKAFQIIRATDVEVQKKTASPGVLTTTDRAVGHMVLADVVSGTVLTASQISSAPVPADAESRRAVTLPIPLDRLDPALKPGSLVEIVFNPLPDAVGTSEPVRFSNLPVLAVTRLEASAGLTVAVPEDRMDAVLGYVGKRDLFVTMQMP